jgi:hypothetical protein
LGTLVLFVYWINGREIPNGDTIPARLLPIALIRGDGPFLDRFNAFLVAPDSGGRVPYYVARKRGHLVSSYPIGAALLAVPFYLPQVIILDWLRPGWERRSVPFYSSRMAKNTAAALGALTAVAIFHLLRRLGLARMALPTALATALASNLWASSQTLWQHVPAALLLTLSLILLVPAPPSRFRLCLAGLTTVAMVWIRPQDILIATVIPLWAVWYEPRKLVWFLPFPVLLGTALIAHNYWFFGALMGGYSKLGGTGTLSVKVADLLAGLAGNLWSPRRSLLVYCPWMAFALAAIPTALATIRRSVVCWLLWALIPYILLYSSNTGWWGGHYFGPRYFTDVIALFAVLLGFALNWSWTRCRPVFAALAVTIACGTAIQFIGAYYYPSTWEEAPVDIDQTVRVGDASRAWDWRDNELTRCLAEGPIDVKGWEWWLIGFAREIDLPLPLVFELYEPGDRIDFTKTSVWNYLDRVWHAPEPEWARDSGREAGINFRLARVQPLRLRMMANTYRQQSIIISLNGRHLGTLEGDGGELQIFEIDLPVDVMRESNTLHLSLPDAKSPRSVADGNDRRVLGIAVAWMELVP